MKKFKFKETLEKTWSVFIDGGELGPRICIERSGSNQREEIHISDSDAPNPMTHQYPKEVRVEFKRLWEANRKLKDHEIASKPGLIFKWNFIVNELVPDGCFQLSRNGLAFKMTPKEVKQCKWMRKECRAELLKVVSDIESLKAFGHL